ncbi:MAG: DJ-1/PfpI family protein [Desulfuromonadales bacterium]|nr:DJ-1/PfpI family protein [Desulfuromonadales bacterium]
MPKTLIPLAEGFEEIETLTVVDVLRRAGISVVLAGLQNGPVESVRKVSIIPDEFLDTIKSDDFDMIILPGGQPGTSNLSSDIRVKRLLVEFSEAGKLIAAICAATTVLAEAGIIKDKRVTSYPTYKDKLNGAFFVDNAVVSDGNIITSQGPGTAMSFALAIVSRLAGQHAADTIARELLVNDNEQQQLVWDKYLFNSTVQSLVEALEMKDRYTQGHAKRVTDLSLSIGAKLSLSAIEMRDLYLGSMLHDIGKVATEHDVLSKVESLNLREETLIREHPIKGTLCIVGIDNLNAIVPTILHHHERWDGTGYPARLKGEQIPLHARIVCVADAFAAMISNRSFRPGMSKEQAMREIQKQKGSQFDPFIVDVLIECLNDSPYEMKDFSFYF